MFPTCVPVAGSITITSTLTRAWEESKWVMNWNTRVPPSTIPAGVSATPPVVVKVVPTCAPAAVLTTTTRVVPVASSNVVWAANLPSDVNCVGQVIGAACQDDRGADLRGGRRVDDVERAAARGIDDGLRRGVSGAVDRGRHWVSVAVRAGGARRSRGR